MHCEHKFKRAYDQIFKCKFCGKVIYRSKKQLIKNERRPNNPNR